MRKTVLTDLLVTGSLKAGGLGGSLETAAFSYGSSMICTREELRAVMLLAPAAADETFTMDLAVNCGVILGNNSENDTTVKCLSGTGEYALAAHAAVLAVRTSSGPVYFPLGSGA